MYEETLRDGKHAEKDAEPRVDRDVKELVMYQGKKNNPDDVRAAPAVRMEWCRGGKS